MFFVILDGKKQKKTKKAKQSRALVRTKEKLRPAQHVDINEIIVCKMKGYPPWTAKVIQIENCLILVEFFGDRTTYKTSIKNIFKFVDCSALLLANL